MIEYGRLMKITFVLFLCFIYLLGEYNKERLTGRLETSSIEKFSWGIADRGVSVRVPRQVAEAGKGFFEDRRPASNCDPYAVCNAIIETTLLDK